MAQKVNLENRVSLKIRYIGGYRQKIASFGFRVVPSYLDLGRGVVVTGLARVRECD